MLVIGGGGGGGGRRRPVGAGGGGGGGNVGKVLPTLLFEVFMSDKIFDLLVGGGGRIILSVPSNFDVSNLLTSTVLLVFAFILLLWMLDLS